MPVGARRCVHCRTLIGDAEEGSTRLGFGGSRHDDVNAAEADYGNSTSFGRPGSGFGSNIEEDDRRGGMMGGNDAPHQTMLGLGPISSSASRRMFDESSERGGFAQTTISGMPGISFDSSGRQSLRGGMNMGPSQMRTPAREINPVSMGIPPQEIRPQEIKHSSPHEAVAESLMGVSFDEPAKPAEVAAPKVELEQEPVIATNSDDPFANLPGVAPKPSSLVDEEFVDLTSKLFGDDFAAGTKEQDLEDDGWDFDFAPEEPEKKEEPTAEAPKPEADAAAKFDEDHPTAAAVKAAAAAYVPQDKKETTNAAESEAKKDDSSDDKKIEKSEASAKDAEKSDADAKNEPAKAESGASEPAKKADKKQSLPLSAIFAIAACVLGILWIIIAFANGGSDHKGFATALVTTLIASAIGGAHAGAFAKCGKTLWMALLLVGALMLFVAGALTDAGKAVAQPVLIGAALLELISCGIVFLKK